MPDIQHGFTPFAIVLSANYLNFPVLPLFLLAVALPHSLRVCIEAHAAKFYMRHSFVQLSERFLPLGVVAPRRSPYFNAFPLERPFRWRELSCYWRRRRRHVSAPSRCSRWRCFLALACCRGRNYYQIYYVSDPRCSHLDGAPALNCAVEVSGFSACVCARLRFRGIVQTARLRAYHDLALVCVFALHRRARPPLSPLLHFTRCRSLLISYFSASSARVPLPPRS